MRPKQPEAWKHHFVPRSLLRYFRPPGDDEYLYVFNKHKGNAFRASLMNAGSENGFNTLEEGGETINFESDFDDVDALLATSLREIHHARNLSTLSVKQRLDWSELVAVQVVRTPIVRSTVMATFEDLNRQVVEMFGVGLDTDGPSENDSRMAARRLFKDRKELVQSLTEKDMVLFEPPGDAFFRISDRPVTVQSSLPFGDTGFASRGVAIYMPLGPQLMLGMMCPSIGRTLKKISFDKLELHRDVRARLMALREGLATGSVVQLDQTMVTRHNALQIAGSKQFVYGATENFEDVHALLAAHPEMRDVRSSVHIGKMGMGPGPRPHMPLGSWLVLFGRHFTCDGTSADSGEHDCCEHLQNIFTGNHG